jgi:hypothetical protein
VHSPFCVVVGDFERWLPAEHEVIVCDEHSVADDALEYFPAVHSLQAAAPCKEKNPGVHGTHAAAYSARGVFEYFPASQRVQALLEPATE